MQFLVLKEEMKELILVDPGPQEEPDFESRHHKWARDQPAGPRAPRALSRLQSPPPLVINL